MKKRIVIFLSVLLLSASAVFLSACSAPDITQNQRLSELRSDILCGSAGDYSVVLVTGIRENPFEIDGVSQADKVYFTVITVTVANYDPLSEYNFTVSIGGQSYTGKLSRHPYNQSYSAEINALTDVPQMLLTLSRGATDTEITLNSVKGEDFISAQKAFEIAEKELKDAVAALETDYEIFVRLIENPINPGGGYFWYVAFISTNKTTLGVLIDPVTMKIDAVRKP